MKNLKRFYKMVAQDPVLTRQLESITEKSDFITRIIQLGKEKGYDFNPSEVEASIAENTASGQGQFFCLPVGCWHKAEAV